ncbi:hypothetical protein Tco_0315624 [Tanacetum coccineum]
MDSVAQPLILFFASENRLLWFRYREYDLVPLKLVFEFSIYTVWSRCRYGVSSRLDTMYQGFLGVGTTLDIFQNIRILYLEYGVLIFSGYGVLILFPLWSLVSSGTDMPYLLDGYDIPNPALETPAIDGTNGGYQTRQDRIKESYAIILEEIRKKVDAEAKAIQIILTRIDNDIYSIVDACPNAIEIWKAIEG